MENPFQKIKRKEIYRGKVITVHVDTVRYRDMQLQWEIVEQGNSVVVMPLVDSEHFLLIHQYRYTAGTFIWEFPAGRAHDNESLELCAQRELEEECGFRARHMKKVLTYYPSPGISTEEMHLFFAYSLYESKELRQDEDEVIQTKVLPVDTIDTMIKNGEIIDAKTILAFYHFKLH